MLITGGPEARDEVHMGRPPKPRSVGHVPEAFYWKPSGVPLRTLEEVPVALDELEALRLADLEDLSHEEVGAAMGVSRATAGRVLAAARRKVADALVNGKSLRVETARAATRSTESKEAIMPGGDRTGPEGEGQRTGRGLGDCGGADAPGAESPNGERAGRGPRGRGRGRGRGGGGGGEGQGRGRGRRGRGNGGK